jgi:hypothetical protein
MTIKEDTKIPTKSMTNYIININTKPIKDLKKLVTRMIKM